jgi:hypothetical protein
MDSNYELFLEFMRQRNITVDQVPTAPIPNVAVPPGSNNSTTESTITNDLNGAVESRVCVVVIIYCLLHLFWLDSIDWNLIYFVDCRR